MNDLRNLQTAVSAANKEKAHAQVALSYTDVYKRQGFSRMMNEKAKEIGCESTHFITPNGLDAVDNGGEHRTTCLLYTSCDRGREDGGCKRGSRTGTDF